MNVRTPQRHGQSVVNLASQVIVEKKFLSMKAIATFWDFCCDHLALLGACKQVHHDFCFICLSLKWQWTDDQWWWLTYWICTVVRLEIFISDSSLPWSKSQCMAREISVNFANFHCEFSMKFGIFLKILPWIMLPPNYVVTDYYSWSERVDNKKEGRWKVYFCILFCTNGI